MRQAKKLPEDINYKEFFMRLDIKGEVECWEWKGKIRHDGYGVFSHTRNNYQRELAAHRVSYQYFKKNLNLDKVIDHICRNRKCSNPAHLREVSKRVNSIENSTSFTAVNARKTHCKKGHPLRKFTKYSKKERTCKICLKESRERYIALQKEKQRILSIQELF